MDRGVLDTSATIKIKNAVLLTDDGGMHFHAKEAGTESVLIRETNFEEIGNLL